MAKQNKKKRPGAGVVGILFLIIIFNAIMDSLEDAAFLIPIIFIAVIAVIILVSVRSAQKNKRPNQTQNDQRLSTDMTNRKPGNFYGSKTQAGSRAENRSFTMDRQYAMQQRYSQQNGQKTMNRIPDYFANYQESDSLVGESAFDSAGNHPKWYNSTANWGNTNTNYNNMTNNWGSFEVKGAGAGWNKRSRRVGKGWKGKKQDDNPFLV
ncbi:MAG: hypothetical protein U0L49_00880 [Eubacterium sp.]|nr:hypothetical protein [Eubacterium sp.]